MLLSVLRRSVKVRTRVTNVLGVVFLHTLSRPVDVRACVLMMMPVTLCNVMARAGILGCIPFRLVTTTVLVVKCLGVAGGQLAKVLLFILLRFLIMIPILIGGCFLYVCRVFMTVMTPDPALVVFWLHSVLLTMAGLKGVACYRSLLLVGMMLQRSQSRMAGVLGGVGTLLMMIAVALVSLTASTA